MKTIMFHRLHQGHNQGHRLHYQVHINTNRKLFALN